MCFGVQDWETINPANFCFLFLHYLLIHYNSSADWYRMCRLFEFYTLVRLYFKGIFGYLVFQLFMDGIIGDGDGDFLVAWYRSTEQSQGYLSSLRWTYTKKIDSLTFRFLLCVQLSFMLWPGAKKWVYTYV